MLTPAPHAFLRDPAVLMMVLVSGGGRNDKFRPYHPTRIEILNHAPEYIDNKKGVGWHLWGKLPRDIGDIISAKVLVISSRNDLFFIDTWIRGSNVIATWSGYSLSSHQIKDQE